MHKKLTSYQYLASRLAQINDEPGRPWSENPCIEWDRCLSHRYGQLRAKSRNYVAHRLAYELKVGPIPEGLVVCHHCDNPACFRPSHLFAGTMLDNMQDCARKGRSNHPKERGEAAMNVKLKEVDVLRIRQMHSSGVTQTALARAFRVTQANIWHIVKRKTWIHI